MTASLVVREAKPSDIHQILAVWKASDVAPSRTDDAVSVEGVMRHPTSTWFVAEEGGRIVATVIAAWNGWRGALYRLAVAPTHRRSGIATALVGAAEERLIALGARRLHALVLQEADEARAFWLAKGYDVFSDVRLFTRNPP